MLKKNEFDVWLAEKKIAVIDGALATELEARGHDLNHPMWSAKSLMKDPESIRKVHLDYFLAGADIAITASYQATIWGLEQHFQMTDLEGEKLLKQSVHLARRAREDAYQGGIDRERQLLVVGSVGPFGAYLADGSEYRGDYIRTTDEFQDFHRARIQALIDAEVDLLALETMPNLAEIEAICTLLKNEFPASIAWLSCTARNSECLSDGSPWSSVLDVVNRHADQIIAVGVNCVPLTIVTDALTQLGQYTTMPLLCYPNSGEEWDAETKTWNGVHPDDIMGHPDHTGRKISTDDHTALKHPTPPLTPAWIAKGARLIGGCCRTGPAFVQAVRTSIGGEGSR